MKSKKENVSFDQFGLEEKEVKVESKLVKIVPLKDHVLYCPPAYRYELKEGEEIEIDKRFLNTLKTEKVIN